MTDSTPWITPMASSGEGSCVEMRRHDGMIEVRDSKDREGPVLRFTNAEFAAWLDGVNKGEFDHLT
jgi:hypothetical protein